MSRRSTSDILAAALENALVRRLGDMRDLRHNWIDWHSATFVGARHVLRFTLAADRVPELSTIADDELPLARGFVADIAVIDSSVDGSVLTVELEALTIAD